MNKNLTQNFLEKKLISKKNRYSLSEVESNYIKKLFQNKNIFIAGACGSIGCEFVFKIINYKFKKLLLLDKDENNLTDLNRKIIFKKKKNVEYICSDLTSFNLDNFIKKNKIHIYLNFAAVKHVRSEENLDSIKYMLKTNSVNFCPKFRNKLKVFFSISSDKSVNPSSLLGFSKYLMEKRLMFFSKKFPQIHISTSRFANVAFSRGSYLEYVLMRIKNKLTFGIPMNISRYFITKQEATSLCLRSLLPKSKNKIIVPNPKTLKNDINLYDIVLKILKINNFKPLFTKNISKVKNKNYPVIKQYSKLVGQKTKEEFFYQDEIFLDDKNPKTSSIKFKIENKNDNFVKYLIESKNKKLIIKKIKKKYKFFKTQDKTEKISSLV